MDDLKSRLPSLPHPPTRSSLASLAASAAMAATLATAAIPALAVIAGLAGATSAAAQSSSPGIPAGTALGKELRVNTLTAGARRDPAVAYTAGGEVLFAWTGTLVDDGPPPGISATSPALFQRRLSARGLFAAPELAVRRSVGDSLGPLDLADVADQGTLFVWPETGSTIFGQTLDAEGSPEGAPHALNEPTTAALGLPSAAAIPGTGFAVAWAASEGSDATAIVRILTRRLDLAAQPLGDAVEIESFAAPGPTLVGLAADPAGNVLVTWSRQGDGSGFGVFGQFLDSTGAKLGLPFRVSTRRNHDQSFATVAALGAGEWMATWQSGGQDGSGDGIFAQRLALAQGKVGPEFRVNTATFGPQRRPSVAADAKGNFVIVWQSQDPVAATGWQTPTPAEPAWTIRGQLFHPDDRPAGGEIVISQKARPSLFDPRPRVAFGPQGEFTVVWEGSTGAQEDIYARRFAVAP
jgi:hypothetical protein